MRQNLAQVENCDKPEAPDFESVFQYLHREEPLTNQSDACRIHIDLSVLNHPYSHFEYRSFHHRTTLREHLGAEQFLTSPGQ